MFGKQLIVRIAILVGLAVLGWSVLARSSSAHGNRQVITVRPYDTLWTIASQHYGGDVRDAVWRIERANRLPGADIQVGEKLVLP
jgi:hypothetical protein